MIRYAVQSDFESLCEYDRHISGDELQRSIDTQRVLVMFEGDSLIGWLRFSLFWDEIPFMNMLYLLEGYRGKGFGAQLTRRWEGEMAKRGHKRVLTSTLSNEGGSSSIGKTATQTAGRSCCRTSRWKSSC